MVDRYTTVMTRGQAFLNAADFPAALGEFSEALKYHPQSADAHYSYAFAAAEEIGMDFNEDLANEGISLGRLHTTWREAMDPAHHPAICAVVRRLYGERKCFAYKLAVAHARKQLTDRCLRHLKRTLIVQPRHELARTLFDALHPLAATSPVSALLTLLR
jgi:hypothetical protein